MAVAQGREDVGFMLLNAGADAGFRGSDGL
jgi:hypothetical protein